MNRKTFAAAALVVVSALATVTNASAAPESEAGHRPPACSQPPPEPPPLKPTTVTTIGQAYHCIYDNHFSGPTLDSRTLLQPAFAALTQELQRQGADQAAATLPALKGKRDADWAAFSRVYQQIEAKLTDPKVRQAVAGATLGAMLESLNDNHARWGRPNEGGPETIPVGIRVAGTRGPGIDPAFTGPVFVTLVAPGSGAANAGIRPGDEILAVNGIPAVFDNKPSQDVLRTLGAGRPGETIKATVRRPATGETLTLDVKPVEFPRTSPQIVSKLLPGDVAYVTLPGFGPGFADKVLQAIADLRKDKTLRGVILDLRGNGGGSPQEVSRLLGGWTHSKATSYFCDVHGKCTPNSADATVPLVNLPLVALTDRNCASACDSFTSTVKDLKLGTLVGTRTAGAVSGPGAGYVLDDGSMVMLPKLHEIGANRELVDTIGVAPDHVAPLTAAAVSAGRDPGIDKALTLLK